MHSPPWAEVLQNAFAICNCSRAIRIQGDCKVHLRFAQPPTNAAGHPAVAAEILQLQPRFCNCSRDSAVSLPKGSWIRMARLQLQIANALCRTSLPKGEEYALFSHLLDAAGV